MIVVFVVSKVLLKSPVTVFQISLALCPTSHWGDQFGFLAQRGYLLDPVFGLIDCSNLQRVTPKENPGVDSKVQCTTSLVKGGGGFLDNDRIPYLLDCLAKILG